MGYDVKVLGLATSFGGDADLTDDEVAILAQVMQDTIEEEIEYLLTLRKDRLEAAREEHDDAKKEESDETTA